MPKKYKKKRLKIPLSEYIVQFGIKLEDDEKQIVENGVKLNYVAKRNGDIISYQTDCKKPIVLKPIIIQTPENNEKLDTYDPSKLYRGVNLMIEGKEVLCYVHRLIAKAFITNPENKQEVNHIDGDKGHNYVENLEWNTESENQQHAIRTKLKIAKKGSEHHAAKINEETAYEICKLILYSDLTLRQIAEKTNSTHAIVTKINKGQRWRHVSDKFNLSFPLYSNRNK